MVRDKGFLGLLLGGDRDIPREFPQDELSNQIGNSIPPCDDEPIPDGEACASILRGPIDVRDACRREVAQDMRVVRLRMTVVPACDDSRLYCVEGPRTRAPISLVEVSRILVEK